jgi:2,3-bisphosphoglycerate-independent phosphoglycerate mutase
VSAVETVDTCLGAVLEVLKEYHYSSIVIADHGNADFALNVDGTPNTAHTTNPVPVLIIDPTVKQIRNGKLADIAPTILQLMDLDIPDAMNGDILV